MSDLRTPGKKWALVMNIHVELAYQEHIKDVFHHMLSTAYPCIAHSLQHCTLLCVGVFNQLS